MTQRIDGDEIVLSVPHRGSDVAYPLLVDPTITEYMQYWWTDPNLSFAGWNFGTNKPGMFTGGGGDWFWGRGLYLWSTGGDYLHQDFGQFAFDAPHGSNLAEGSKITTAEFDLMAHNPAPWPGQDCVFLAVYGGPGRWDVPEQWQCGSYDFWTPTILNTPAAPGWSPGNAAVFGLMMFGAYNRPANHAFMGGSRIVLEDNYAPHITAVSWAGAGGGVSSYNSNTWYRNQTLQPTGVAIDYGVGLKWWRLTEDGGSNWATNWLAVCSGDRTNRCPTGAASSGDLLRFNTNTMSDGTHNLRIRAGDWLGNETSTPIGAVKVDTHAPTGSFGGELSNLNGQTIVPGDYQLQITNVTDAVSGLSSIQIEVNGGSGWVSGGPPTRIGSSANYLWTLKGQAWANLATNRTVQVRAVITDLAGNLNMPSLSVTLRPRKADPMTTVDPALCANETACAENRLYAYGIGDIRQENLPSVAYPDLKANSLEFVRMRFNAAVTGFQRDGAETTWDLTSPYSLDPLVKQAAAQGLQVMPVLTNQELSFPFNAKQPDTPARATHFAKWAKAVAQRYGPGGSFWQVPANAALKYRPILAWEVWNEENSASPKNGYIDYIPYADLIKKVGAEIRGAQPQARIVFGGLDTGENALLDYSNYLWNALANTFYPLTRANIDAVAVHPYDTTADHAMTKLRNVRADLNDRGFTTTQIWPNEIGWAVNNPDYFEDNNKTDDGNPNNDYTVPTATEQNVRTQSLLSQLRAYRQTGKIGPIAWFSLKDNPAGVTGWGDSTGLRGIPISPSPWPGSYDGENRPAFNSMRTYGYEASTLALP